MKKFLAAFVAGMLPAVILMVRVQPSHAGSATRKANPSQNQVEVNCTAIDPVAVFARVEARRLAATHKPNHYTLSKRSKKER
jgi:hypothetical protein